MKWLRTVILFDRDNVAYTDGWRDLHESYVRALEKIDHPEGSGKLKLRRKRRRDGQWDRNGVNYLKSRFFEHMTKDEGWEHEGALKFEEDVEQPKFMLYPSMREHVEPITSNFGGFDFVAHTNEGAQVAIEWETGNISSSHRSMNKLAIALKSGIIEVGVLIVPSRNLYEHLTDRIGNISELSAYLAMWAGVGSDTKRGLFAITVVEHDELTDLPTIPYLPSGNDGRAREGKAKRKRGKGQSDLGI